MSIVERISTGPTVVEVRAPRCPACSAMERDIKDVAARSANTVAFIQVDASTDPEAASSLGVRSTPTIIGYRNGSEVYRSVGRLTSAELTSVFDGVAGRGTLPRLGFRDMVIRIGAGVVIIALGLATGPTWPLVGIGIVAAMFGLVSWVRTT